MRLSLYPPDKVFPNNSEAVKLRHYHGTGFIEAICDYLTTDPDIEEELCEAAARLRRDYGFTDSDLRLCWEKAREQMGMDPYA